MRSRVNGPVLVATTAFALLAACASERGITRGGSTIEILYLTPMSEPAPGHPASGHAELGDGSAASEMVAGARRLLGVAVDGATFERHVLAGALVERRALRPVASPSVGDLARGSDLVAVVETVEDAGHAVVLVGARDARVTRWTRPASGLRFERP